MRSPKVFVPVAVGLALLAVEALPGQSAKGPKLKPAMRELRAAIGKLDEKPGSGRRAVAAIEALSAFDGKPAANALLDAARRLAGLAAPIAGARGKALRGGGGSGRLKRTRYELRNVNDSLAAVARTLRSLRSEAALAVMLKQLAERGSTLPLWLRFELAGRIGELSNGKSTRLAPRGNKKLPVATRLALLAAAESLGPRADDTTVKWVVEQMQHGNVDVRVRAVAAMAKLARPAAIEQLIVCLDQEQGVVHEALLDALTVLTGVDPGDSAASWRAWLAAEGGPFVRGERPLGKGDAGMRKRSDTSGRTVVSSYFGIPQTGDSILYVFDNSLSMKAKLRAAKGKGPTTGGGPTTRWDLCRVELKAALRGLRPQQRFNLVSFANKARCFEGGVIPADPKNVARAIAWIDGLKLEFETNVFDALELAFLLAGRGVDDRYYTPEVDTLFFLSDGAPTIPNRAKRGIGQDDCDRILASVRRWNAMDRVTIHAVGIGLQDRKRDRNAKGRLWPAVFLRKLAAGNGGRYVLRR